MQVIESRFLKAARRTFRAELTLILVVLSITSWSIYALYKFSVGGGDSILGFPLSRLTVSQSPQQQQQDKAASNLASIVAAQSADQHRQRVYDDLLAGEKELGSYFDENGLDNDLGHLERARMYHHRARQLRAPAESQANLVRVRPPFGPQEEISSSADEDNPDRVDASESNEETTNPAQTPQPSNDEENEETTTMAANVADQDSANEEEPTDQQSDDPSTSNNNNNQQEDPEQAEKNNEIDEHQAEVARSEGLDIDHEVDRMSEPSSSSVSRHADRQAEDSNRSLVQFDDNLNPPLVGDSLANLSDPTRANGTLNDLDTTSRGRERPSTGNSDLETDYNRASLAFTRNKPPSNSTTNETRRVTKRTKRSPTIRWKPTSNSTDSEEAETQPEVEPTEETSQIDGDEPENEDRGTQQVVQPDKLHKQSSKLPKPEKRQDDTSPEYHYLSTNDSSLNALLNHQKLLDDLRQTLPSPVVEDNQLRANSPAVRHSDKTDHQPAAGSLFTVDHGLLVYPESDEHHEKHHKSSSMSKKKKKASKSKKKKKSTVAMKKGGHKKKKHKKEEKKFLKEKKFKGAKKGKKVAKGKGGQGGKKGKKLFKDKGFKKKGFKNVYHKEEFGQKKSYFDEFRDKDFKKKWKKYDDKYNYAQMKKWQAKDIKGAKKMKDSGEKMKKYDKSKWKKKYEKHMKEHKASSKKKKKKKESHSF